DDRRLARRRHTSSETRGRASPLRPISRPGLGEIYTPRRPPGWTRKPTSANARALSSARPTRPRLPCETRLHAADQRQRSNPCLAPLLLAGFLVSSFLFLVGRRRTRN